MTYRQELERASAAPASPWPIAHRGCNVTTCPATECRTTGQCKDAPRVESPPLVPTELCGCYFGKCFGNPNCRDTARQAREAREAAPRTIIAFTGLAGAGKSTAAAHLVNSRGFQRVRFAGPIKAMMLALGCTAEQVDGSLKETPCDLLCGRTPRWAMQSIGTEWGRELIGSDLWIRAWEAALANVPADVPVVVDDCRFPNEAAAVTKAGGILVRVERPGAGTSSVHASEQHALPAAGTIHNTADERALGEQIDVLLRDLSWRSDASL